MNVWKLFANSKILPEKNFKVDSLDTYLSTLTKLEITGLTDKEAPQYIKHSLDLFIKINKSQSTLNFFDNANNYNYMSIQNTDDTYPVYYFIIKKEWVAKNTLGLVLKMDTVNTFTTERNSFTISDRTMVNREHKDRLKREVYWKDYPLLSNAVQYRVNNTPSTSPSMVCFFEDDDLTNKIVVRKYSANGYLLNEYEGQKFSLEFVALSYVFRLYNSDNEVVFEISLVDYKAEYLLGKYMTLQLSPNYNYQGLEYNPIQYKVRDIRIKRLIDLYPEGINPPLYKEEIETIGENEFSWYLVYKNQNDPSDSLVNPVDCFLCADEPIEVKGVSNVYEIEPNDLGGAYDSYALLYEQNKEATLYYRVSGQSEFVSVPLYAGQAGLANKYDKYKNICIFDNATSLSILVANSNSVNTGNPNKFSNVSTNRGYTVDNIDKIIIVGGKNIKECGIVISLDTNLSAVMSGDNLDISVNETLVDVKPIAEIDKTDPKIIKIIKVPYCPTYYDKTSKVLGSGEWEWDGVEQLPKLKNLNSEFNNTLRPTYNPLSNLVMADDVVIGANKNSKYESKLYHSDYYRPKFVYDSFGFEFSLEKFDTDGYTTEFRVQFNTTGTINSRFLFTFIDYQCPKYATEDYNNILFINRNNEITIYNQQFLNYLRAGYNYDVKAKERSIASAWIGAGVGAIASYGAMALGGPVGMGAGIVSLGQTITSFTNAIISTANAEANIEAKMAQLKNQATSVSGADDVDLMSIYTNGNKAKYVLYQLSPKMKECMFDVFYYTGYISGVMKLPDFTSRYWFNFVSCDLALETNINIPENCLEDLKNRYNEGITVMHAHSGSYDWNREKENWENSLL